MIKSLEKIKKLIYWYYNLPKNYVNIAVLMEARKKLAVHCFELAEVTGDMKMSFDNSYADRKIAYAEKKVELMNDGMSGTAAEARANSEISKSIRQEKEFEGAHSRCRLLLTQANEVLSCLNQHISLLKLEKHD